MFLQSSSYCVCNGAHPSHSSTLHFCDVVFAWYLPEMWAARHDMVQIACGCAAHTVFGVVKPHARHRDAVAAVQALPARCSVSVRQTMMTKMNRCISTEPWMGSKQPVWKLFNMVTMTTINHYSPLLLNLF